MKIKLEPTKELLELNGNLIGYLTHEIKETALDNLLKTHPDDIAKSSEERRERQADNNIPGTKAAKKDKLKQFGFKPEWIEEVSKAKNW